MGTVVVTEFVTLDGVIEDPGGAEDFEHGGWSFKLDRGDDGNKFKLDELMGAEAQLLGRVTYEGFAAAWPQREGGEFGDFAKRMNSMPKYVVSASMSDADATWQNTTVLRGELANDIARIKEEVAGSILVAGSATLVRGLHDHGLIDEYRLMVFPVVLGSGKRMFEQGSAHRTLRLLESRAVGSEGVLVMTYAPA